MDFIDFATFALVWLPSVIFILLVAKRFKERKNQNVYEYLVVQKRDKTALVYDSKSTEALTRIGQNRYRLVSEDEDHWTFERIVK